MSELKVASKQNQTIKRIMLFTVILPSIVIGISGSLLITHLHQLNVSNSIVDIFLIVILLGSLISFGTVASINYYLFHRLRLTVLEQAKLNTNSNSPKVKATSGYQPVPDVAERTLNRMRFKLKNISKRDRIIEILALGTGVFAPILHNNGFLPLSVCIILGGLSGFIIGGGISNLILIPTFEIIFISRWKKFMMLNQDALQNILETGLQSSIPNEQIDSQTISTLNS